MPPIGQADTDNEGQLRVPAGSTTRSGHITILDTTRLRAPRFACARQRRAGFRSPMNAPKPVPQSSRRVDDVVGAIVCKGDLRMADNIPPNLLQYRPCPRRRSGHTSADADQGCPARSSRRPPLIADTCGHRPNRVPLSCLLATSLDPMGHRRLSTRCAGRAHTHYRLCVLVVPAARDGAIMSLKVRPKILVDFAPCLSDPRKPQTLISPYASSRSRRGGPCPDPGE